MSPTQIRRALTALMAVAGFGAVAACSNSGGQATPTPPSTTVLTATLSAQPSTEMTPKAAHLCNFMTPADFPVQGQMSAGFPEKEDRVDSSVCRYQIRTGGDIAARFGASLTLFPGGKLRDRDFEGRQDVTIGGKRAALGQGKLKGNPGECDMVFESAKGAWFVSIVDESMPGKDGCLAARSVGEKVAARVP